MKKRLNPRRSKIHRAYTVEEIARLFNVHKRTVRNWIKDGLPVIDKTRPLLVLGTDLRLYIREKRKSNKRKCKLSEIYCLRCRAPRSVAANSVHIAKEVDGVGRVFARCYECDSKFNKYFSWRQLNAVLESFDVENTDSAKTHKGEG